MQTHLYRMRTRQRRRVPSYTRSAITTGLNTIADADKQRERWQPLHACLSTCDGLKKDQSPTLLNLIRTRQLCGFKQTTAGQTYSRSHTAASARPTLTKPKEYSKGILAAIRQLGSSTNNEKASLPHRPKPPNIGLTMHHWIVPNGHRYSETRCAASKEVTQRVVSALVSNRRIRG